MPRRVEALLVSGAAVLVYALTRSGNHSETEDSVAFAVRVRDASHADLVEGAHLVYLTLGRAFAHGVASLGVTDDPLVALQTLDAILGAAAAGGLWLLLRRAGLSRLSAGAAVGIAACSYAFWRNATEPEVYALSAAALVGCLAAAWTAARSPHVRSFAVLGAVNGVAVLAHVTNVLFAIAAATAIVLPLRWQLITKGSAARFASVYAAAAAFLVVPGYAAAAVVHRLGSGSEFWEWFTERSGQAGDFGHVELANLTRGAFGSARALIGGHSALSLEPIHDGLTARFAGKTFSEELFFLEGFSGALALALLVLAIAAVVLVAVLAGQWLRPRKLDEDRKTLAVLAVAWLAPYVLFLLWWDPLNIELWYAVWLPAAILLALPLDGLKGERQRAGLVLATVAVLFSVNLFGSVLPQRNESRDLWRAKADWYRANVRSDDLIVSNGYLWSAYLRYLVNAHVVDIEDLFREAETEREAIDALRRRIESARGRVLVSGEAFHAFADRRRSCADAPRTCAIAAATARELREGCELLAAVRDPFERVWRCGRTA